MSNCSLTCTKCTQKHGKKEFGKEHDFLKITGTEIELYNNSVLEARSYSTTVFACHQNESIINSYQDVIQSTPKLRIWGCDIETTSSMSETRINFLFFFVLLILIKVVNA